jgi:hypothetical protein
VSDHINESFVVGSSKLDFYVFRKILSLLLLQHGIPLICYANFISNNGTLFSSAPTCFSIRLAHILENIDLGVKKKEQVWGKKKNDLIIKDCEEQKVCRKYLTDLDVRCAASILFERSLVPFISEWGTNNDESVAIMSGVEGGIEHALEMLKKAEVNVDDD